MEVILLERMANLGQIGDVVKVKNGYGRNFLIPQSKALRATKENKEVFEAKRAAIEAENAAKRAAAQEEAKKFEGVSVEIVRQASDAGNLFGSVSPRDAEEALKAKGFKVSRQDILIKTPIKSLGEYTLTLALHAEVEVPFTVNVVRTETVASAA